MCRNDVPMCPTCCSLVCHVLSMFSKRVACSHNIPTGHMAGTFLEHQWQPYWMLLVSICWTHVEVTFQMYPRCNWWIHWGKNDPEPAMYLGCSHWFPGHLAPSITSPPVCWSHCRWGKRTKYFLSQNTERDIPAGGGKELRDKRPPCRYIYQDSVRKYYQIRQFTK